VSYDLQIYAARALPAEEIRTLVAAAGLTLEDTAHATESMTVLRGAKQNYSFTLALPLNIEPEDVPDEVTAAALDPSHLYELLVEGSSSTEIPHATKFARRNRLQERHQRRAAPRHFRGRRVPRDPTQQPQDVAVPANGSAMAQARSARPLPRNGSRAVAGCSRGSDRRVRLEPWDT
jgi:hypothetical protein